MLAVRQLFRHKDISVCLCDDVSVGEDDLTRAQIEFVQIYGASCFPIEIILL